MKNVQGGKINLELIAAGPLPPHLAGSGVQDFHKLIGYDPSTGRKMGGEASVIMEQVLWDLIAQKLGGNSTI